MATTRKRNPRSKKTDQSRLTLILSFVFGVTFVSILLVLAVYIPRPTQTQFEIFRIVIAIAVAGIAAVVPGFLQLDLTRNKELAVRAGGALAVFVIVYFYSPAHWVATPEKPNVRVGIDKTEHVYFIRTTSGDDTLPKETPSHSFTHEGGLSLAYEFHDFRVPTLKPPKTRKSIVIIPEGEVAVNFVVTNFGQTTSVVDSITIELISTGDLPPSNAGEFLPALEPYQDIALLKREQTSYPLFYGKVFTYPAGQSDVYRIDIRVADSEPPGLYKVTLAVKHHYNTEQFVSYSEPVFIAKYLGGRSNRNVYAKFGDSTPPRFTRPAALRVLDGIDSIHKKNHYYNGNLAASLTIFADNDKQEAKLKELGTSPEEAFKYVTKNLHEAILGNSQRVPVQSYGFVLNGIPVPGGVLSEECWRAYSGGGNKDFFSIKPMCKDGLEVYERRSSHLYNQIVKALVNICHSQNNILMEKLGNVLVEASKKETYDVAALIDVVPLLALANTDNSLMRVKELLSHPNVLVRRSAVEVFSDYRFEPASKDLLSMINTEGDIVLKRAIQALEMSADREAFEALLASANVTGVAENTVHRNAALLKEIDPGRATDIARQLPSSSPLRLALESFFDD
ncbi:hypothetical protein [Methylomonas sp. MgM2]